MVFLLFLNQSPKIHLIGEYPYPVQNCNRKDYIDNLIKHAPIIWWAFCASACDEQRPRSIDLRLTVQ